MVFIGIIIIIIGINIIFPEYNMDIFYVICLISFIQAIKKVLEKKYLQATYFLLLSIGIALILFKVVEISYWTFILGFSTIFLGVMIIINSIKKSDKSVYGDKDDSIIIEKILGSGIANDINIKPEVEKIFMTQIIGDYVIDLRNIDFNQPSVNIYVDKSLLNIELFVTEEQEVSLEQSRSIISFSNIEYDHSEISTVINLHIKSSIVDIKVISD